MPKAGLPEYGEIEQTFHQNDVAEGADDIPGKQASLGARQEAMREGGADAAAVEIDDAVVLAARKDDAAIESVAAVGIHQTTMTQAVRWEACGHEMTAEVAGGIADGQFLQKGRIVQSALGQVMDGLGMAMELELKKGSRGLQQIVVVGATVG